MSFLTSCEDRESAGPTTTEFRSVPAYHQVEVRGSFQVEISNGESDEIRIEAPRNLLPYIESYVQGERLIVEVRKNRVKFNGDVVLMLNETALNHIELDGSGRIIGDTIYADHVQLTLNGSGRIDLPVQCNDFSADIDGSGGIDAYGHGHSVTANINGSGDIDLKNIPADDAETYINGSGAIEVYAAEFLDAEINGSGTIRYWGHPPVVSAQVNGSGKIIEMD